MTDRSPPADAEPEAGADVEAESDIDPAPEPTADRTTVRSGRNFEEHYRLDASEAGDFLIELGEQLRGSDEVRLVTDEWELPFAFGEPIELEIDFEGVGEPELEIELELPGRTDDSAPTVE
ncbi:amphi-Trp domain-containing protein [Natronomonas sp. F2-12]|jgi:amphi-Trp domain-containing protein|uniref:Amphi-Trp domain-containing protein n=1 Tax=Natronomonas aquatica TaxID=2841590 RepID=A0A9R1CSD2_9EURY|nr:amphi-Trp domain-containing protein [Natronomonas aquatica]MCQ4333020.1 amphi-Trp domain-containing protein [Natronomonas aquatica]